MFLSDFPKTARGNQTKHIAVHVHQHIDFKTETRELIESQKTCLKCTSKLG